VILLAVLLAITGQLFSQTNYVIQPGDTLYAISRRFGVSMQAIASANNIINPDLIYAGQVLIIPTDGASPPPTPPPGQPPVQNSGTYVVQRGDTLFRIAVTHGLSIAALIQVNGIANPNLIYPGQVLIIPGATVTPTPQAPPESTVVPPTSQPQPVGVNLLPNPSFEQGYYHLNGIPELQVPNSWSMEVDQGQPAPGTGITLVRPESRVLPRWLLPSHEHSLFIWHGDWTVKVFKGGEPFSVRYSTQVTLQPGTYQFSANYFPDLVAGYDGNQKVWSGQPSVGEVAFIKDGVGAWRAVSPGSRNSMVETFTVTSESNVRIGLAFRTRYIISNNGFFFDDWSLQRLSG